MSDGRRVKFSTSPTPRSILKQSEPHPRDSGVGSSSSDHTGSSGSLDERFTDRDYNIQSNNVDALREALSDAIKDIDNLKKKCNKKDEEVKEARKKQRNTETLYNEVYDDNRMLQAKVASLKERMENQDTALEIANRKIADLEDDLADWKEKYSQLDRVYQSVKPSASGSVASGSSSDHYRTKSDSSELARLKERINRDTTDSASSRSSDTNTSSKRTGGHKTSGALTVTDSTKPYIEPMPRSNTSALASPRQPGSYTLTTADRRSDGHATSSSSRRHETRPPRHAHHEQGDYVPHPLPGRRAT